MRRKSSKTVHKGTLVIGEMIEITDPAEKAEVDRRFREAEKALAAGQTNARKARPRKKK